MFRPRLGYRRLFKFVMQIMKAGRDICLGKLDGRMPLQRVNRGSIHIIAGGPSFIKSQEFVKKLPGDILMVNYIFESEFADKYPPQYWVSADYLFTEDKEFIRKLRKYSKKHPDFIISFPSYRKILKNLKIKSYGINVKDIKLSGELDKYDLFLFRHNLLVPRFSNSVTLAVYFAIQRGYKTIYLHGCELQIAFLFGDKNNNIKAYQYYTHSYDTNSADAEKLELRYIETNNDSGDNPWMYKALEAEAGMYLGLHHVATYAKSLGVKIYNMSETSVVDEFEKWKYEV